MSEPPRTGTARRATVLAAWAVAALTAIPIGIALNFGFYSLVVAPWIMVLFTGPTGSHGILNFYWTVSPEPWWLAVRAGICAVGILVVVVNPKSWIQRTRDSIAGRTTSSADVSFTAFSASVSSTGSAADDSDDEDALPRALGSVALFFAILFAMVGIFAGTDLQGAHDHAQAGSSQCFAGGHPTPAAPGHLEPEDAIYYTVGNLTTAGTGSLAPVSTTCRIMTTLQTAIGAVVILFGIGGLLIRVSQHPFFTGGGMSDAEIERLRARLAKNPD